MLNSKTGHRHLHSFPTRRSSDLSRPQYVWWAKIKNGKGQVGWTDQTDRFTHIDRFAFRLPSGDAMKKKVSRHHRRNEREDRKSTRLNSSHLGISYAVFCLKKKKK